MDLHLQGKHALVTGGSSGVGEGIAFALAQEGVIVIVHGREQSKARRVAEAIQALGGMAFVVTVDLATDEGADQDINARRLLQFRALISWSITLGSSGSRDGPQPHLRSGLRSTMAMC